jgi:hypothetical protein
MRRLALVLILGGCGGGSDDMQTPDSSADASYDSGFDTSIGDGSPEEFSWDDHGRFRIHAVCSANCDSLDYSLNQARFLAVRTAPKGGNDTLVYAYSPLEIDDLGQPTGGGTSGAYVTGNPLPTPSNCLSLPTTENTPAVLLCPVSGEAAAGTITSAGRGTWELLIVADDDAPRPPVEFAWDRSISGEYEVTWPCSEGPCASHSPAFIHWDRLTVGTESMVFESTELPGTSAGSTITLQEGGTWDCYEIEEGEGVEPGADESVSIEPLCWSANSIGGPKADYLINGGGYAATWAMVLYPID